MTVSGKTVRDRLTAVIVCPVIDSCGREARIIVESIRLVMSAIQLLSWYHIIMEENRGIASSSLDGHFIADRIDDEVRPDGLQGDDGQGTTAIISVKPLGALLWSLFSGIAYGVVAFSFMALVVFIIDSKGILASMNSLLGEATQLSASKLYALSALFAIVIAVFTSVLKWLNYMLYNASSRLLGPVKTIIEIESLDRKSKSNREARRTPRSVHSAVNGEVKR